MKSLIREFSVIGHRNMLVLSIIKKHVSLQIQKKHRKILNITIGHYSPGASYNFHKKSLREAAMIKIEIKKITEKKNQDKKDTNHLKSRGIETLI
jgi:hypothetical protein